MDVPDALRRKMALYRSHGRIVRENMELFAEVGWLQVLHGQGIKRLGQNLVAEAFAPDGLIEGVRVDGSPAFAFGV